MDDIFDNILMTLALGGLAVSLALFASAWLYPHLRRAWDKATALARAVFCGAVAVACLYGGAKHGGTISYPKTDTDVAYLIDAGSYVTNDAVHVTFTRVPTVPDTATFYLDYCALDGTNEQGVATNWVNAKTATFADLTVPFDFAFAAATNYNWMAYTDWTPGPAVQTNGVWHAYWGVDKKEGRYFIPVRTCVRDGGSVIATPKSKWDAATRTPDDYVQDGLIAMWDGEWNAGRGKHDPNATVWVDLTGNGYDLYAKSETNTYEWSANSLVRKPSAVTWRTRNLSTEEMDLFKVITHEVHAKKELLSGLSDSREFVGAIWSGIAWYSGNSIQVHRFTTEPRLTISNVDGVTGKEQHTYSLLSNVDCDIMQWTMFVDADKRTKNSSAWSSAGYPVKPSLWVGMYEDKGSKQSQDGNTTLYCIRVYNRELTAEEVAHNYAVDKARFGSGNE